MKQETLEMLQGHFGKRRRVLAPVSWRKGLEVYRSISIDNRDELIFVISNSQLEQVQDVEEVLQRRVQFRSPNLALLSEAGTLPDERGYWICRMELASSFRDIVRENRKNPKKLVLFVQQVAMGLVVVHKNSGFHGDLRPSTIFVKHVQGQDRAFSMGMALDLWVNPPDLVELSSKEVARFIPPELTLGEELGPSTDIYSIGVLLYHVVCGGFPFAGSTPRDIVISHTQGFWEKRPEHVDVDIWNIIVSCLQIRAEERIDIEDLINQLQPFTIGRRSVYIQTQEMFEAQSKDSQGLEQSREANQSLQQGNFVPDYMEEDSYSQELLDFRFPSSLSSVSMSSTNEDQRGTEKTHTDKRLTEFSLDKDVAESSVLDTTEDMTNPMEILESSEHENTDQITDTDITSLESKKHTSRIDLFHKMNEEQTDVPSSEELNINQVPLIFDPLDTDISEEISVMDYQKIDQSQELKPLSTEDSEGYSYEYESEVYDSEVYESEISESEDITSVPLAVFIQPSEKKLEVTKLEVLSEEVLSAEISEEIVSAEISEEIISAEIVSKTSHEKFLKDGSADFNKKNKSLEDVKNSQKQSNYDAEIDSDQTMFSEDVNSDNFIFEHTLKGMNVHSSRDHSEQKSIDEDRSLEFPNHSSSFQQSIHQSPLDIIDMNSGREVSISQTSKKSRFQQREMTQKEHRVTPRVELERILPLEEKRIHEEDISDFSNIPTYSTNVKQSLVMFAVGFFAFGSLFVFLYSLIVN